MGFFPSHDHRKSPIRRYYIHAGVVSSRVTFHVNGVSILGKGVKGGETREERLWLQLRRRNSLGRAPKCSWKQWAKYE